MRPLTSLFPPVRRVTFGGVVVAVDELRVRDVVMLQQWLDDRAPDPLETVGPLLYASFVAPGDRHLFSEALDGASRGPAGWGSDRAGEEFGSVFGVFAFLKVVLRKNYGMTDMRIVELMERIQPGDLDGVIRAAYHTSASDELDRAVRRLTGAPRSGVGEGGDWPKWIDDVARSHRWSYEHILTLTVTQFFNALNEGQPPRKAGASESPGAARKRWERWIGSAEKGAD